MVAVGTVLPNQRGVHPALSDRPGTLPPMTMTLAMVTTDSTDPGPLAAWWAEQLGGTIVADNGGFYYMVQVPSGPMMAFQMVEETSPGKNRLHLDLVSPDRPAEVERLLTTGATKIADRDGGGFRWTTLADPAGNEFCVADAGLH
jgi:hypothetical protein